MNKIKVTRKNDYFCVVATKRISKGEIILNLQGTISASPNKYSIQIGEDEHISPFSEAPMDGSSHFRFINHSCEPNSYFNIPYRSLIALKDIDANTEVNFHYCTTEYEMASPFKCMCGAVDCLSEIKGFRYLPDYKKEEIFSQLAPHLKIIEDIDLEYRKK